MKVPGKKTMSRMDIVFMAELSRFVSLAMIVEVSARLRFVLTSLAAMNW